MLASIICIPHNEGKGIVTLALKDRQTLLHVAQWTLEQKYLRVEKIRQLVGTEENYRIIIREIDRVKAQRQNARTLRAEATLTLLDWLMILERFDWQCAYCRTRPFKIMSHIVPLPRGGTTPENCVPSCYSCLSRKRKLSAYQDI
jgi:5-methylcytosine-specific restriction endonuclease McrA